MNENGKQVEQGPSQYKDAVLPVYGFPLQRLDGRTTLLSL